MPDDDPRLHDLNPTRRFSDRAVDYVRFRPGYPPAAIDVITDGISACPDTLLAEIGAGTGICTRLIAARGYRVVAVEPNPEMRSAAALAENVEWRSGTAEETGLAESFEFPNCQRLDLEGLIGRAMSASYVPKSGGPHQMLVERLEQLYSKHADSEGLVTLKYVTQVYRAVCGGDRNDASSD